ncbi:MAG: peroxiredoxin [Sandaracinaceae bacterium]
MRTASILVSFVILGACGSSQPESSTGTETSAAPVADDTAAAPALLTAGTAAPDFHAPDQSGATRSLADANGGPLVLYFYPRDATPGCTVEACAFRDAWTRYEEAHVAVFGVSMDGVDSHRAFAEEHELPFPLIADESGAIARSYGVDTTGGYARRVTFLIGPDGTIAHVFDEVDPGVHADEVLARAAELED